jgi:predicted enzyme related to lactoylglutathione lyase
MFQGLFRVILYTQDMESEVRFYRDVLGLRVKNPPGLDSYLHGGGQKRLGADTPNLVFRVEDVASARRRLIERGAKIGEIRVPVPGTRVADGFDPEGHRFSIQSFEE